MEWKTTFMALSPLIILQRMSVLGRILKHHNCKEKKDKYFIYKYILLSSAYFYTVISACIIYYTVIDIIGESRKYKY